MLTDSFTSKSGCVFFFIGRNSFNDYDVLQDLTKTEVLQVQTRTSSIILLTVSITL